MKMEGDRPNRTTPKRNKISRCFISSARSVLHFLGIHNHSDDDEIWEQRTLERIEVRYQSELLLDLMFIER